MIAQHQQVQLLSCLKWCVDLLQGVAWVGAAASDTQPAPFRLLLVKRLVLPACAWRRISQTRDRLFNARPQATVPSGFWLCSSKGAKRTTRSARDHDDQLLGHELSKSTLRIYHQLLLHAYPVIVDTGYVGQYVVIREGRVIASSALDVRDERVHRGAGNRSATTLRILPTRCQVVGES